MISQLTLIGMIKPSECIVDIFVLLTDEAPQNRQLASNFLAELHSKTPMFLQANFKITFEKLARPPICDELTKNKHEIICAALMRFLT
jgi:hypothetical protein